MPKKKPPINDADIAKMFGLKESEITDLMRKRVERYVKALEREAYRLDREFKRKVKENLYRDFDINIKTV